MTHSFIVIFDTGINGHTSVAPIRGCSPLCLDISISSEAVLIELNAASITLSGGPIKVTTVRFIDFPESTSNKVTLSTILIDSQI